MGRHEGRRAGYELVRTITEGYASGEGYLAPTTSPYGKYVGQATDQGDDKLIGTAAYWDGKWDHGVDDGDNAPARLGPMPTGHYYAAYLVLDGVPVLDPDEYVSFVKTL